MAPGESRNHREERGRGGGAQYGRRRKTRGDIMSFLELVIKGFFFSF
jgi:hypothetical protein